MAVGAAMQRSPSRNRARGGGNVWLAAILASVMLLGCSAPARNGPALAALAHGAGALKPGQGRVVVYREKGYGGIADAGWKVDLDGETMGKVKTGTFIYKDRPAGPHKLVLDFDTFPRPSHREFDVAPGHVYVF